MSVLHCIGNYVPGILNWAEMYDVAGLIAQQETFDAPHSFSGKLGLPFLARRLS